MDHAALYGAWPNDSRRYYESLFKTSKYLGEFRLRVRGIVESYFSRRSSSAWAKKALASFRISLALRTHSFKVCATQPIFEAINSMVAHSDG